MRHSFLTGKSIIRCLYVDHWTAQLLKQWLVLRTRGRTTLCARWTIGWIHRPARHRRVLRNPFLSALQALREGHQSRCQHDGMDFIRCVAVATEPEAILFKPRSRTPGVRRGVCKTAKPSVRADASFTKPSWRHSTALLVVNPRQSSHLIPMRRQSF